MITADAKLCAEHVMETKWNRLRDGLTECCYSWKELNMEGEAGSRAREVGSTPEPAAAGMSDTFGQQTFPFIASIGPDSTL